MANVSITLPGGRDVVVNFVRSARARRYLLRVKRDGVVTMTIPARGTVTYGREFLSRNIAWIERALAKIASRPQPVRQWSAGMTVLFRGVPTEITVDASNVAHLGNAAVGAVRGDAPDLRPMIEKYMAKLAARELTSRTAELAAKHGLPVKRISVRNQRSRWGSCSMRGTISLNWRLIQTPEFVRDYIILHELMHMKQMNHSPKFWGEVKAVCPDYMEAERWLKANRLLSQVVD